MRTRVTSILVFVFLAVAVPSPGKQIDDQAASKGSSLAEMWRRFEIIVNKQELDDALATGDPGKWRPIMGQARHFNVSREKGIELLRQYLDHADAQVRTAAAEFLFQLGSREGGPVLINLLKEAAEGKSVGSDLAMIAGLLHQYRYPVDADLIYAAYLKNQNSRLLMYAQLLSSPLALPETKQRLLANGTFQSCVQMAGLMRLNDPRSLEAYAKILKSHRAVDREEANWALYAATNDPQYLDYLIAVAEETVGLRSRTDRTDGNTGNVAIMALSQALVPKAKEALERIEAKARTTGMSVEASRALLGLYYFHHDYKSY